MAPSAAALFLSLGAGMRPLLCSQQVSARNPESKSAKIRLSNLSCLSPGVLSTKLRWQSEILDERRASRKWDHHFDEKSLPVEVPHAGQDRNGEICRRRLTRDQRRSGDLTVKSGGECRHRKITRH